MRMREDGRGPRLYFFRSWLQQTAGGLGVLLLLIALTAIALLWIQGALNSLGHGS